MHFNRIFLCLLCLSVIFLGGCSRAAATDADMGEVQAAVQSDNFIDTLTFLGDSTTAHMLSRAPLKDGKSSKSVWAAKNRYLNLSPRITYEKIVCPTNGMEMTIAEVAATVRPSRLVITLGVDYGVYYYRDDPDTFAYYYEKLLNAIGEASPQTTVILQSIFPVGKDSAVITNEMIDRANAVIADIAKRRSLVYVDANTPLKDAEGYLAPAYCYSEDGIHLSEAGYNVIFQNLKKYEKEISEKQ